MKTAILATLVGSAAAFVPQGATKTSTAVASAMDDLKDLAEKSNPVLKVSQHMCHRSELSSRFLERTTL